MLGRVSQETIAGGIADISAFQSDPEFFACVPARLCLLRSSPSLSHLATAASVPGLHKPSPPRLTPANDS